MNTGISVSDVSVHPFERLFFSISCIVGDGGDTDGVGKPGGLSQGLILIGQGRKVTWPKHRPDKLCLEGGGVDDEDKGKGDDGGDGEYDGSVK